LNSNEIDQNDLNHEKHDEQRISTFRGIVIDSMDVIIIFELSQIREPLFFIWFPHCHASDIMHFIFIPESKLAARYCSSSGSQKGSHDLPLVLRMRGQAKHDQDQDKGTNS
jgi:hypothetical protein